MTDIERFLVEIEHLGWKVYDKIAMSKVGGKSKDVVEFSIESHSVVSTDGLTRQEPIISPLIGFIKPPYSNHLVYILKIIPYIYYQMIKPLPNPIQEKDATVNFMWSYIKAYQKEIRELGIKLKHNKIQSGYDRYYYESGESFDIFILDLHLQIGYVFVTEDHDDWAQAETHESKWLNQIESENEKHFDPKELYHLLTNYHSILREKKLNQIL